MSAKGRVTKYEQKALAKMAKDKKKKPKKKLTGDQLKMRWAYSRAKNKIMTVWVQENKDGTIRKLAEDKVAVRFQPNPNEKVKYRFYAKYIYDSVRFSRAGLCAHFSCHLQ